MAHSTVSVNQLVTEEFKRPCCIRGYHVYQEIWTAAGGEEQVCEREPDNSHDCLLCCGTAFATSRLARAIACDGIDSDKGPLGFMIQARTPSCSQCGEWWHFLDCKYFIALIIRYRKCFEYFNFQTPLHIQKCFNAEIFPNYGTVINSKYLKKCAYTENDLEK